MSQDRSREGHVRQVHLLLAVKCEVTEADFAGAWRIAIILLHGIGVIHGRVLRACAASCAGIHTHPFQHQRGVNRTPYRPRLSRGLHRAKTVVFRWSAAIQPGFFAALQSDSCFGHR
jgi:hypothetical protein